MSDESPMLGVKFTFLDYVALGLILPAAEEMLRRPTTGWPMYVPGFVLGLTALAFRNKSPQIRSWFVNWLRAPERLTVALAENVNLKQQLGELRSSALARVNPSNDDQVRRINETHQGEMLKQEAQAKSDLIRAQQLCEEEKRDYANRCLEYRAELARYAEMFTPLQIDTLSLAKELRAFAEEMGEEPTISSADYPNTRDGQEKFIVDHERLLDRRQTEFRSKFRLRFGDGLKQIVNRLGAEGISFGFVDGRARADIESTPDALRTAEYLVSGAYKLTGIRLYPPTAYDPQELEMMAGNERQRRLREEPGFAETWGNYQRSRAPSDHKLDKRPDAVTREIYALIGDICLYLVQMGKPLQSNATDAPDPFGGETDPDIQSTFGPKFRSRLLAVQDGICELGLFGELVGTSKLAGTNMVLPSLFEADVNDLDGVHSLTERMRRIASQIRIRYGLDHSGKKEQQ